MDLNFLIDMAWKSALIAGAALGLTSALRSRAPADRVLVLRIGASLLLALPAAMLLLPSLDIAAFSAPEPAALGSPMASPIFDSAGATVAAPTAAPALWDDPTPLVLLLYLGGLAWAGSRLLAGLVMLHLWTRGAHRIACSEWQAAFEHTRWTAVDAERVRLLVSDEVASPLSWGWSRPTILIDRETLRHPEDADAILAHEMAHIARGDWPLLLLIRAAAALFWFNPLVWLLEREAVQQAEEAADLAAAERVEPLRYAETLLSWAQSGAPAPVTALAIAPSARSLGRRIRAVLDRRERPAGSAWTALAMLACLALALPIAATRLVAAQPEAPAAPAAPEAPNAPAAPRAPAAPSADEREVITLPDGERIVITLPDGEQIERSVNEALARARIPEATARAMAAARPEITRAMAAARPEIARALREAQVELARAPHVSQAAVAAAMADAVRHSERAQTVSREQVVLAMREAARVQRQVHRDVQRSVRYSMAAGADGMRRGADGMERGARHMEEEARRLQDPAYRERCIERARARGETVTHGQLIEAARGMREGAEGMREGARDMREAAEDMRRDARDHDDDDNT